MFDVALFWVKDYGPILAAIAIAGSSIYTAAILRRQNRATGWLQVKAYKVQRVGGIAYRYREGENLTENDRRRQETHVWIVNVGYRLERIMQVEYHVVSQGWLLGPQPPDTIYPDPEPEPFDVGIAAPHRMFAVPFDIDPQHLRCWEYVVGHRIIGRNGETIRDDRRLHQISCVKVVTFKGETIHARLLGADKPSWLRLLWCEFRCKVGVHR